jgi:hypothetical protein
MNLKHDPLIDIDLTRSLPNLKASLSGPRRTLNVRRNTAAEEFSAAACKMMLAWALGFFALLATALLLWA